MDIDLLGVAGPRCRRLTHHRVIVELRGHQEMVFYGQEKSLANALRFSPVDHLMAVGDERQIEELVVNGGVHSGDGAADIHTLVDEVGHRVHPQNQLRLNCKM